MRTNRVDYIYQLTGKIIRAKKKVKKNGKSYWQLAVIVREKEVQKINAFSDSCLKKVWSEIEENKYLGKEYIFYCKNFMGSYYLVNWEVFSVIELEKKEYEEA